MAINKKELYGENTRSWHRHQNLQEQITRKALDLPEDMNQNIRTGMSWKELLAIGAIIAIILGGYHLATRVTLQPPPSTPPPTAAAVEDRDTTRRIEIEKYIPPGSSEK